MDKETSLIIETSTDPEDDDYELHIEEDQEDEDPDVLFIFDEGPEKTHLEALKEYGALRNVLKSAYIWPR